MQASECIFEATFLDHRTQTHPRRTTQYDFWIPAGQCLQYLSAQLSVHEPCSNETDHRTSPQFFYVGIVTQGLFELFCIKRASPHQGHASITRHGLVDREVK